MRENTNNLKLSRQEAKSLKDLAYDAISDGILSGDIPVGTRLKEPELSEQLGISRGPIREALNLLMQDGFIVSIPHKGAVVVEVSARETEEVYIPIRRIVEHYAFHKAHHLLNANDYAYLEEIIQELAKAYRDQNMESVAKLDFEFHRYVVSKCTSPALNSIWHSLSARITRRIYSQTRVAHLAVNIVEQHKELLQIVKRGDEEQLKLLLQGHFI